MNGILAVHAGNGAHVVYTDEWLMLDLPDYHLQLPGNTKRDVPMALQPSSVRDGA